jgi:hypothetical protein
MSPEDTQARRPARKTVRPAVKATNNPRKRRRRPRPPARQATDQVKIRL